MWPADWCWELLIAWFRAAGHDPRAMKLREHERRRGKTHRLKWWSLQDESYWLATQLIWGFGPKPVPSPGIPTQVIVGDRDQAVTEKYAEQVAAYHGTVAETMPRTSPKPPGLNEDFQQPNRGGCPGSPPFSSRAVESAQASAASSAANNSRARLFASAIGIVPASILATSAFWAR